MTYINCSICGCEQLLLITCSTITSICPQIRLMYIIVKSLLIFFLQKIGYDYLPTYCLGHFFVPKLGLHHQPAPPFSVSHTLVFIYLNQTYCAWYKKYIRFCERNFSFADKHNLLFTTWTYCTIGSRWKFVCLCLSDCIFNLKCLTKNSFTW